MDNIQPLRIGMFKAIKLCKSYKKLTFLQKEKLRTARLQQLVGYAKQNSPYYQKLYQNIGENFVLSDLPPVTKKDLMANWNNWITDKSLTLAEVEAFMQNPDNIGRKLNGSYLVFTTSGSTGNPLVALCDTTVNNIMSGISALRAYARKQDLKAFIRRKGKTIGIFADKGFYLSNSSVRARLLAMPWKKYQMAVSSALLPTPQIVAQLNQFQPAMLGGYPSNLELLIEEQKSGRLHISPVIIMTGGEYLSEDLRKRLADAFQCYVQTSYACTEGGCVACECTQQHFHINDDWIIVEPVDKSGNPVKDGVLADKWLLTNLFNYTQPFIRYEITDRIIMHHEPCACGNPAPWLEVEGRNDDVVTFIENGQSISIPPLAIYATLKEVPQLTRFQLLVYEKNQAALRLIPAQGVSKEAVFDKAQKALTVLLAQYGISTLHLTLSKDAPQQHPKSGKFKHILHVNSSEDTL
ncbi:MAG: AMP-binding protein [Oscillospiraceae bacterium]|nr:AMP-binding protein [Oscillospiraceae bacterium]